MKTAAARIPGYEIHRTSKIRVWKLNQQFIEGATGCENPWVIFYGVWNFLGQIWEMQLSGHAYSYTYTLKYHFLLITINNFCYHFKFDYLCCFIIAYVLKFSVKFMSYIFLYIYIYIYIYIHNYSIMLYLYIL